MNRKKTKRIGWMYVLMGILFGFAITSFFIDYIFSEELEEVSTYDGTSLLSVEEMVKHQLDVQIETASETKAETDEPQYIIDVTEEDIDLMARVVMSEGSILPQDAKQGIAQTIVNRVRSDFKDFANQTCVKDVVYYPNAYSTQNNGNPTDECYRAVYAALMYEGFPTDMLWFRENKYHSFAKNYCHIGSTYFSRVGE